MEKSYGWTGKILRIDLTSGEKDILQTSELAERFIGGRGFVSKLYWDEVETKTDALHPDNPLLLMTGPLAGAGAISGNRWFIAGKSPLLYPDQFGLGNVGGSMATKIKAAGFDGIIITGRAKKPSYLHIQDDTVDIKDAVGLWGCDIPDTLARLRAEHGEHDQDNERHGTRPPSEDLDEGGAGCARSRVGVNLVVAPGKAHEAFHEEGDGKRP